MSVLASTSHVASRRRLFHPRRPWLVAAFLVVGVWAAADEVTERGMAGGRLGLVTYPEAICISAAITAAAHMWVSWREHRRRR